MLGQIAIILTIRRVKVSTPSPINLCYASFTYIKGTSTINHKKSDNSCHRYKEINQINLN